MVRIVLDAVLIPPPSSLLPPPSFLLPPPFPSLPPIYSLQPPPSFTLALPSPSFPPPSLKGPALEVDRDLLHGCTTSSPTFDNAPLCSQEHFKCGLVEVWAFEAHY